VKRWPSYLLLFTLALASLIPAGWMPASSSDGKVLLVICTTDGTQEQWVDLDGDTTPAEQMDDRSCPFSALATAGLIPENSPIAVLETALSARWAHEPFTHYTAGFHWRYDARGPPALS
jgi:hypothetical protein